MTFQSICSDLLYYFAFISQRFEQFKKSVWRSTSVSFKFLQRGAGSKTQGLKSV